MAWIHRLIWIYAILIKANRTPSFLRRNLWGPRGGGGVCAPLIPENNALIFPTPWKKVPQLPENIFPLLPKSLKLIQLLPNPQKYKPILPKINRINNGQPIPLMLYFLEY